MVGKYTELDGAATLAYAEVLDNALAKEISTGEGFSFISAKRPTSKGRYWYLQHTLPQPKKRYYLGAETPELLERIQQQEHRWKEGKVDATVLERQVAMALAAGCAGINYRAYRVLNAAAQSGLFRTGGVLVGSYAFLTLGNMLGVSWQRNTTFTQDVDLASSSDCMMAVPADSMSLKDAILSADESLLEVPMLDPRSPSTSFHVRGKDFRVDLITPMLGKDRGIKYVAPIKSYARPLRFLDFILEDTQKAVLLHKAGVVVNVPNPARFAIHKLVLSQRRPSAEAAKSRKDRLQAEQLLNCLLDQRPGDLWITIDSVNRYDSKKFRGQLKSGLSLLEGNVRGVLLEKIAD